MRRGITLATIDAYARSVLSEEGIELTPIPARGMALSNGHQLRREWCGQR